MDDAHDRDVSLAYAIAGLTRGTKGLPKLETLLRRKHKQTVREQVETWQLIAAKFGGKFVPAKEAR
jgi:hypothetical protein